MTVETIGTLDIYKLFKLVEKESASDLLISAGAPPILRVNGELFRTRTEPLTPEQSKALIYSFLSEAQYNAFEVNRELDISLAVEGKHRFRVNVYMQKGNVSAALRPIPETVPSVIELGLPEIVTSLARSRQGLILVTGPTGSGKTTTQAALVDLINSQRACHIITVEDPIEYIHHHRRSIVDQREVGGDTESFSSALKYVLRQDPDVILVGEMRDLETIQAALTAAETGHLVLATLHTNDAIQTIDRVVDVFPPQQQQQVRFQFSMALLAILSQRLIPHRTKKKRVLACEVLRNNSAIANLIREQKSHQVYSVVETAAKEGMITMDRAVKDLYSEGRISFDDAVSLMRHPKELDKMGV